MKKKVKTTLLVEDIKDLKALLADYDGDVEGIKITPDLGQQDVLSLLTTLDGLELYEVVSKPDPNLEDMGITLDYYAVEPIPVKDINLTDEENIIFNGKVELPRKGTEEKSVVGAFFTDVDFADNLCQELNEYTNERVSKLQNIFAKSLKFRREIADKAMS